MFEEYFVMKKISSTKVSDISQSAIDFNPGQPHQEKHSNGSIFDFIPTLQR